MVDFKNFSILFKKLVKEEPNFENLLKEGRKLVSELTGDPSFLKDFFERVITDDDFAYNRWPTMDYNEITLHRDEEGLFSVRLFLWYPHVTYYPHSHGSWGIVGCITGEVSEIKYRRLDDGKNPFYAELKEDSKFILKPGETTYVLPLNEGIHSMFSNIDKPSLTLHVYGKPVRKGYFEIFEPSRKTIYRVYSNKYKDRVHVINILKNINADWSLELLKKAKDSKLEFISEEASFIY